MAPRQIDRGEGGITRREQEFEDLRRRTVQLEIGSRGYVQRDVVAVPARCQNNLTPGQTTRSEVPVSIAQAIRKRS